MADDWHEITARLALRGSFDVRRSPNLAAEAFATRLVRADFHPVASYITRRARSEWLGDDARVLASRVIFLAKGPRMVLPWGTWRATRRRRGSSAPAPQGGEREACASVPEPTEPGAFVVSTPDVSGVAAAVAALAELPGRLAALERQVATVASEMAVFRSALPPTLVTVAEAAEAFKVSTPTMRRWAKAGKVPTVKVRGTLRVDLSRIHGITDDVTRARLARGESVGPKSVIVAGR